MHVCLVLLLRLSFEYAQTRMYYARPIHPLPTISVVLPLASSSLPEVLERQCIHSQTKSKFKAPDHIRLLIAILPKASPRNFFHPESTLGRATANLPLRTLGRSCRLPRLSLSVFTHSLRLRQRLAPFDVWRVLSRHRDRVSQREWFTTTPAGKRHHDKGKVWMDRCANECGRPACQVLGLVSMSVSGGLVVGL